jgi:hypothetical protein
MSIWQINRSGEAFLRNELFTRRKGNIFIANALLLEVGQGVGMQLCTTSCTNNTHIKRIK